MIEHPVTINASSLNNGGFVGIKSLEVVVSGDAFESKNVEDISVCDGKVIVPEGRYDETVKDYPKDETVTATVCDGKVFVDGHITGNNIETYHTIKVKPNGSRNYILGNYPVEWTKLETVTIPNDYNGWVLVAFENTVLCEAINPSPAEISMYISNGQIAFGVARGFKGSVCTSISDFDFMKSGDTSMPFKSTIDDGELFINTEVTNDASIYFAKLPIDMTHIDWTSDSPKGDAQTYVEKPVEEDWCVLNNLVEDTSYVAPDGKNHPSYKYSDETMATAQYNTDALMQAMKTHRNIKLRRGVYPFMPPLVVDNTAIDLNQSILYNVQYKYQGRCIKAEGENVLLMNGELVGTYDTGDKDAGYSFFEGESAIGTVFGNVGTATYMNLDIHNWTGSAVMDEGGGSDGQLNFWAYRVNPKNPTPIIESEDDGRKAFTATLDLENLPMSKYNVVPAQVLKFVDAWKSGEYSYIAATGGLGYYYIISDYPIRYQFYNKDRLIEDIVEMPRRCVRIPNGTTKFSITTYAKSGRTYPGNYSTFPQYNFNLYKNDTDKAVYKNCHFHNNSSLDMANFNCDTYVYDCVFEYQGMPRPNSIQSNRNTVCAIDIEDTSSPYLYMENCDARNSVSHTLCLDGAYISEYYNCTGAISQYRGWWTNICYHKGPILHNGGKPEVDIFGHDIHLTPDGYKDSWNLNGRTQLNAPFVHATKVTSDVMCNQLWKFKDITVNCQGAGTGFDNNIYYWGISNKSPYAESEEVYPHAKINYLNGSQDLRFFMHTNPTDKRDGSETYLEIDNTGFSGNANYGALVARGDIYNLKATNLCVCPNGHEIHNSTFEATKQRGHGVGVAATAVVDFSGSFHDCKFITHGVRYWACCAAKTGFTSCTTPIIQDYYNCDITMENDSVQFSQLYYPPKSIIRFHKCTLNGNDMTNIGKSTLKSKLFQNGGNVTLVVD